MAYFQMFWPGFKKNTFSPFFSSQRARGGGEFVIVFSLIIFLLSSYCTSDGHGKAVAEAW